MIGKIVDVLVYTIGYEMMQKVYQLQLTRAVDTDVDHRLQPRAIKCSANFRIPSAIMPSLVMAELYMPQALVMFWVSFAYIFGITLK